MTDFVQILNPFRRRYVFNLFLYVNKLKSDKTLSETIP